MSPDIFTLNTLICICKLCVQRADISCTIIPEIPILLYLKNTRDSRVILHVITHEKQYDKAVYQKNILVSKTFFQRTERKKEDVKTNNSIL